MPANMIPVMAKAIARASICLAILFQVAAGSLDERDAASAPAPVPLETVNAVPMMQRILGDPYGAGTLSGFRRMQAALALPDWMRLVPAAWCPAGVLPGQGAHANASKVVRVRLSMFWATHSWKLTCAGPIMYKTAEAALWTWYANLPRDPSRNITSVRLTLTHNCS